MTVTSPWNPITTAPRDGELCLLFDPLLDRSAYMPRGRRVHNDFTLVGRWHVPQDTAVPSDWVSDIRTIDHDGDQPFWDACPLAPTHWMALPNAPPGAGWSAVEALPIAYEYVLLYVPGLSHIREHPMAAGFEMIVGCQTTAHLWLSDLCETRQIDNNDPEDLGVEAARVAPTYWMALPPSPQDQPEPSEAI